MEYINEQALSVEESAVGFDLDGDGTLNSTIALTIEYDLAAHPVTNGYYGKGRHCRFNLFDDTDAPMWRLYLHKSNAANERLADGLSSGRNGPWSTTSDHDLYILTALATMRKKHGWLPCLDP